MKDRLRRLGVMPVAAGAYAYVLLRGSTAWGGRAPLRVPRASGVRVPPYDATAFEVDGERTAKAGGEV